jgi:hypothetical protein
MEKTFTEENADVLAGRRERRQKNQAAKASGTGVEKNSEALPITEAAATGQAEDIQVTEGNGGQKPFRLFLKAPAISKGKSLNAKLFEVFPDAFVAAASGDEKGKGIDRDAAAAVLVRGTKAVAEQDSTITALSPEDAREIIDFGIREFYEDIAAFDPAAPDTESRLSKIADCVWILAGGHNEGVTRENLPTLLLDNLAPEQFADLLRAILRCIRGSNTSYENDIHSRF